MTKGEKRCYYLCWKLIEYKLMYYRPDYIKEKFHEVLTIPDSEYDKLEKEYSTLCKKYRIRNTIISMIEPDTNSYAVKLILKKYGVSNV